MASPPITIAPFDNVPAPGSPIASEWAQDLTTYVAGRVVPYYATTTARDDPTTGLIGAERKIGSVCQVGTATGTGVALPRFYAWDGTAWQVIASWGTSGRIGCTLTRTQSIAHNTYVDVTDYTESYDPDGFYPGSGTTVTLPAALGGVYIISFSGLWAAASGVSGGSLVVNGAGFAGAHSAPMATFSAAVVVALAGGATVRGQVYHNVGVATNVSARLCLQRIAV